MQDWEDFEVQTSLFDGTNCGLRLKDKSVFAAQSHPETSPGPQSSHYHFVAHIAEAKR